MADVETGNKEWSQMTWQEKREERFKRWLNPPGVKFVNQEAKQLYNARVNRLIKAIKLEEPDRVPVMLPMGNSPAYWGGGNLRTLMYDYKKTREIWIQYMAAFGDMDVFEGPAFVPSGKISEVIGSKMMKLPGLGLPEDAMMYQFVEDEYMMADEYDLMMMDPTDFNMRVMMPRSSPFFEPFKRLPPFRSLMGSSWVSILSIPEIQNIFQVMMGLTDEHNKMIAANMELNGYIQSNGYPSLFGGGPLLGAPFDSFGDALRGTRGIFLDMYQQPKKLHEAMEWYVKLTIEGTIKNFPMTANPICLMPLHKGDDTFMSDKQFEEFYWPTLRAILLAVINEGLVPMPFAEGIYNKRLKQIADTPKSGVIWWFDQTDMKEAKRIIGDICCIVGNVPSSMISTGTPEQIKDNCRKLIEDCATGGGYILGGGAAVDNGKFENFKAMMDTAKEYGVYKK
jgi:hypothetical protein